MGSVENVNGARLAGLCSRQFFIQVIMKVANAKSGHDPAGGARPRPGLLVGGRVALRLPPSCSARSCPRRRRARNRRAFYFGDFNGGSMLGDRRQLTIATSEHRYFDTDQLAIRATNRLCINVNGDGRASTFGPIVSLTSS